MQFFFAHLYNLNKWNRSQIICATVKFAFKLDFIEIHWGLWERFNAIRSGQSRQVISHNNRIKSSDIRASPEKQNDFSILQLVFSESVIILALIMMTKAVQKYNFIFYIRTRRAKKSYTHYIVVRKVYSFTLYVFRVINMMSVLFVCVYFYSYNHILSWLSSYFLLWSGFDILYSYSTQFDLRGGGDDGVL